MRFDYSKEHLEEKAKKRHEFLKENPIKPSVCPSCKFCFFDKGKDEWACCAIASDLDENSCVSYEEKEADNE